MRPALRASKIVRYDVLISSHKLKHQVCRRAPFVSCLLVASVDWRRPSNLNAAFSASATAVGLESVPLFETFRYEVDSTCGGILESVDCHRKLVRNRGVSRQDLPGKGGQISKMDEEENVAAHEEDAKRLERYSPAALAFVHPVLAVKWPLGVLLPAGALHNYAVVHRALFKHHVAVHRLRRLRLVLRELDLAMGPQFGRVHDGKRQDSEMAPGSITPCDRSNLHWLHLFRHDMQHMADTLQVQCPPGPAEASFHPRGCIAFPHFGTISKSSCPGALKLTNREYSVRG